MTSLPTTRPDQAVQSQGVSQLYKAVPFFIISIAITFVPNSASAGWQALGIIINFAAFMISWKSVFWKHISIVDPGVLFVAVVTIYTIIPLFTIEVLDYRIGLGQDSRLYNISLEGDIIPYVAQCANAIICSFGSIYLAARRPRPVQFYFFDQSVFPALVVTLLLAVLVQVALAVLGQNGATYSDEYLLIQSLPVIVIQAINISTNMFYVSLFGIYAYFLQNGKYQSAILTAIFAIAVFYSVTSARTPLVLIFFGLIVCWDGIYRRISVTYISAIFALLISVFLALGSSRGGNFSLAGAFAQSEFMTVFVTALDVRQIYLAGSSVGMNFLLFVSDLLRLVPQALLPFEKFDPASWYVSEFYPHYAAAGGGFAFGMLAEAALSGGVGPALFRGVALALLLCFALNNLSHRKSFWTYITYVWLMVSVYQSFRDTTFTLLGRFTFQFLPALLLCIGLAALLRPKAARDTR